MAFAPATAGVVYRCPLCSQRFGGRPRLDTAANDDPGPPAEERTLTAEVARSDPRVIEHLQSHPVIEWLLKVDALEREAQLLRDQWHGQRVVIRKMAEAGNDA